MALMIYKSPVRMRSLLSCRMISRSPKARILMPLPSAIRLDPVVARSARPVLVEMAVAAVAAVARVSTSGHLAMADFPAHLARYLAPGVMADPGTLGRQADLAAQVRRGLTAQMLPRRVMMLLVTNSAVAAAVRVDSLEMPDLVSAVGPAEAVVLGAAVV